MATRVQFRYGTTSQHSTFTGALGEVTVDTDKDCMVVHDGSTAGGFPVARQDASNMANPQFSGTSSLKTPVGTTAQRPSTEGAMRFNTDRSFEVRQESFYVPSGGGSTTGNIWRGLGHQATNLYKRSPTQGTYTATLNENIHNFSYIVTRSSEWRNLKCFPTDLWASPNYGTTNANGYGNLMIDTYNTFHSYFQINTSGNQILLAAGQGNTAYEIWGIR